MSQAGGPLAGQMRSMHQPVFLSKSHRVANLRLSWINVWLRTYSSLISKPQWLF